MESDLIQTELFKKKKRLSRNTKYLLRRARYLPEFWTINEWINYKANVVKSSERFGTGHAQMFLRNSYRKRLMATSRKNNHWAFEKMQDLWSYEQKFR
jgi:hypothetical protein